MDSNKSIFAIPWWSGINSSVTDAPPNTLRDSNTATRLPCFAKYDAQTKPL